MNRVRLLSILMGLTVGLSAQTKVGGACPYLTPADAASVLGAGVKAEPAITAGKSVVCGFSGAGKRLNLSVNDSGPIVGYYRTQIQKLKVENKGKDEAGLGDYAVSYSEGGDGAVIQAIKGGRTIDLRAIDAGTSPAVFDKLRVVMKKVLSK